MCIVPLSFATYAAVCDRIAAIWRKGMTGSAVTGATAPTAAAQGDRSENAEYIYGKKKLREIDKRIEFLLKRLDGAVVVDPGEERGDRVFFGAWVALEDEDGVTKRYQIVGEDEADIKSGLLSIGSPKPLSGFTCRSYEPQNRCVSLCETHAESFCTFLQTARLETRR